MRPLPDSLLAFQRLFPDDDACAAWLMDMRWPDGFVCPSCSHDLDEFVFRFNRRKSRHAAFRSLLALALNAKPTNYNMLIKPELTA